MWFFIADEHFGHRNIIKYCKRPFRSIEEMDEAIIKNHNNVVSKDDTVLHAGDFTLASTFRAEKYIMRLNGKHIFLQGSHDYWLHNGMQRWERIIAKRYIVVSHYSMRTWARSHYNSWQLYGHSHGTLPPVGKQWDIGVDNNQFYPVSFKRLEEIMANRPDNPNFIKESSCK